MAFPPDPEEIRLRLMRFLRPPTSPWMWMKSREGEGEPRARKGPARMGSRMVWPYRITWRESLTGRGVVKVLREERTVGTTSYMTRGERVNLVKLLEDVIGGRK